MFTRTVPPSNPSCIVTQVVGTRVSIHILHPCVVEQFCWWHFPHGTSQTTQRNFSLSDCIFYWWLFWSSRGFPVPLLLIYPQITTPPFFLSYPQIKLCFLLYPQKKHCLFLIVLDVSKQKLLVTPAKVWCRCLKNVLVLLLFQANVVSHSSKSPV